MENSAVRWVGSFRLRDLFERCLEVIHPPWGAKKGVYILTLRPWNGCPTKEASVLYVGGNTAKTNRIRKNQKPGFRFKTRMGECVAGILGFPSKHPIKKYVFDFCTKNNINPLDLYLGWVEGISCSPCGELEVYQTLDPLFNRISPGRCSEHPPGSCGCFPDSRPT